MRGIIIRDWWVYFVKPCIPATREDNCPKPLTNELGNLCVDYLLVNLKLSIQFRFSRCFWKDDSLLRFVDQVKCYRQMLACCHLKSVDNVFIQKNVSEVGWGCFSKWLVKMAPPLGLHLFINLTLSCFRCVKGCKSDECFLRKNSRQNAQSSHYRSYLSFILYYVIPHIL